MMYNPLYAVKALLGDSLATQCGWGFCCCLGVAAFLFVGVVLGPEIELFEGFLNLIPNKLEGPFVAVLLTMVLLIVIVGIVFCCRCFRSQTEDDSDDDAHDGLNTPLLNELT